MSQSCQNILLSPQGGSLPDPPSQSAVLMLPLNQCLLGLENSDKRHTTPFDILDTLATASSESQTLLQIQIKIDISMQEGKGAYLSS